MNYFPLSVVKTEAFQYYTNIHLSVYIPLVKCNKGSSQSRNKLRYCMSIKKIEKALLDKGFSFVKIRELLHPLEAKLESSIWRKNCSGIIVFYRNNFIKVFTHDHNLPQFEFAGEYFYTEPLEKLPLETQHRITASLNTIDAIRETEYRVAWQ